MDLKSRLEYFNPRAPRGARHLLLFCLGMLLLDFNPRAPRGARPFGNIPLLQIIIFQSTRPARGATSRGIDLKSRLEYFNPRAPRGARLLVRIQTPQPFLFQSTRPARGATAKVNKFLCTFLQKRHGFQILLRKTLPFKAFCRLQIGKNFSICGANRCGNFCELLLRTIRSSVLPEGRSACSQSARFCFRTFFPSSKTADYPALDP